MIIFNEVYGMLEIDCSYGEGGGQLVRSALALATVTGKDIKLINIRAKRKKPGLAAQHVTAIKAVAKLCNGQYSELKIGTQKLEFIPSNIRPGKYSFDIGTAGSTTLVLQAWLLPVVFGDVDDQFEIKLRGGTDVNWSPQFEYFKGVFLSHLSRLGITTEISLIDRGYYPKGGGEVILRINPTAEDYKGINLTERGALNKIHGMIHSRNLPKHIAQRMQQAVKDKLIDHPSLALQLDTEPQAQSRSPSTGTGIVLIAQHERTVLGASALGAKGVPAERVGVQAAAELQTELNGTGAVDIYSADQLIPYLALLGGALTVREMSSHTKTTQWLVAQFLDKKFNIDEQKSRTKIAV